MPYKSKAQHRLFRAMEADGELPKGTASEWAHHTPGGIKSLPDKVKKKPLKDKEKDAAADPAGPASILDEADAIFIRTSSCRGNQHSREPNLLKAAAGTPQTSARSPSGGRNLQEKTATSGLSTGPTGGEGGDELPSPLVSGVAGQLAADMLSAFSAGTYDKSANQAVLQTGAPAPQIPGAADPNAQPTQPTNPDDQEYWRQQMVAMMGGGQAAPMMGIQLDEQPVDGTAETLGSPIGHGMLGNGPGVGMSGAGTQLNYGQGVKVGMNDGYATGETYKDLDGKPVRAAIDWGERLQRLKERRDPDGISTEPWDVAMRKTSSEANHTSMESVFASRLECVAQSGGLTSVSPVINHGDSAQEYPKSLLKHALALFAGREVAGLCQNSERASVAHPLEKIAFQPRSRPGGGGSGGLSSGPQLRSGGGSLGNAGSSTGGGGVRRYGRHAQNTFSRTGGPNSTRSVMQRPGINRTSHLGGIGSRRQFRPQTPTGNTALANASTGQQFQTTRGNNLIKTPQGWMPAHKAQAQQHIRPQDKTYAGMSHQDIAQKSRSYQSARKNTPTLAQSSGMYQRPEFQQLRTSAEALLAGQHDRPQAAAAPSGGPGTPVTNAQLAQRAAAQPRTNELSGQHGDFRDLPAWAKQKYQANRRAGKTQMSRADAYQYFVNNYANQQSPSDRLAKAGAADPFGGESLLDHAVALGVKTAASPPRMPSTKQPETAQPTQVAPVPTTPMLPKLPALRTPSTINSGTLLAAGKPWEVEPARAPDPLVELSQLTELTKQPARAMSPH